MTKLENGFMTFQTFRNDPEKLAAIVASGEDMLLSMTNPEKTDSRAVLQKLDF